MRKYISVVIPVYNSEASLSELTEGLTKVLKGIAAKYEIVLVDDGSKDDSVQRLKQLKRQQNNLKLICLDGNYGQQNALLCGLRYAKGDFIVTMDDDLQNPPEEIGRLLDKLAEGYDVVYGIPLQKQHSGMRNAGALMRDLLFRLICGKPAGVKLSSFRAMRRSVAEKVTEETSSFVYLSALILRYTKHIGNVWVVHHPRQYGSSNYSYAKLARLFFQLLLNYSMLSGLCRRKNKPQYGIKESDI